MQGFVLCELILLQSESQRGTPVPQDQDGVAKIKAATILDSIMAFVLFLLDTEFSQVDTEFQKGIFTFIFLLSNQHILGGSVCLCAISMGILVILYLRPKLQGTLTLA